jgi:ATP-dependent DNA helicase RecG
MWSSASELLEKIQLGEDSYLEFKQVIVQGDKVKSPIPDRLADEMVAFANTVGGVLLLGVSDDREVVGVPLEKLDLIEKFIFEIAGDRIKPPLSFISERLFLPNLLGESVPVLRIDIPRSMFVHKSSSGYFVRQGSACRELTPERLARLFQQRSLSGFVRFDETPIPQSSIGDLDTEAITPYLPTDPSELDSEQFYSKLMLLKPDDGGVLRATVGGLLLFGRQPQQRLPYAKIQCVAYHGSVADSNYQLDADDCEGPVDKQIESAYRFVQRNMKIAASHEGSRTDIPQFELRAVYEAIVNAVIHRDYSIATSKIRLFLFSDRLEIYSPGALPNSVTIETLPTRQATRNELLVRFLSRTPVRGVNLQGRRNVLEARGEGVPLVMRLSKELSGKSPKYELFDEELRLTIWGFLPRFGETDSTVSP